MELTRNINHSTPYHQIAELWIQILRHHFPGPVDGTLFDNLFDLGYRLQYLLEPVEPDSNPQYPPLKFSLAHPRGSRQFLHFCIFEAPAAGPRAAYGWREAKERVTEILARVANDHGRKSCYSGIAIGCFVRFYQQQVDGSLLALVCGTRETLHVHNDQMEIATILQMIKGLTA